MQEFQNDYVTLKPKGAISLFYEVITGTNITTKHSNLLTLNIDRELLSDLSILANTLSSLRTKDIVLKKVYEFTKAGGKLLVVEWLKEEGVKYKED